MRNKLNFNPVWHINQSIVISDSHVGTQIYDIYGLKKEIDLSNKEVKNCFETFFGKIYSCYICQNCEGKFP